MAVEPLQGEVDQVCDAAATKTFVDGIATATPDAAHPPQNDVDKPLACRVEIDALRAGGTITNSSGSPADYVIIVVWEQDGVQLATNTAIASRSQVSTSAGTRLSSAVTPWSSHSSKRPLES